MMLSFIYLSQRIIIQLGIIQTVCSKCSNFMRDNSETVLPCRVIKSASAENDEDVCTRWWSCKRGR